MQQNTASSEPGIKTPGQQQLGKGKETNKIKGNLWELGGKDRKIRNQGSWRNGAQQKNL